MAQALVVVSGGMFSTIALAWAQANFEMVRAVSFNFGQQTSELAAARSVIDVLGVVSHDMIQVANVLRRCASLPGQLPEVEAYADFPAMDAGQEFAPMRSAALLTVAANVALSYGCMDMVVAVQQQAGTEPDRRQAFIDAQAALIAQGLGVEGFTIHTPQIALSPGQIVAQAKESPATWIALRSTLSCMRGTFPPCGQCPGCTRRAAAFAEAGESDPLLVRAGIVAP